MRTLNVGLTETQKQNRLHSLGGSDANIILSGDQEKIVNLWLEKTGQKETENLDDVLPVVMGQFTEPLNLYWYEKQTGLQVTSEQLQVKHSEHEFMACTLDGLTTTKAGKEAIFEAKHVNAFSKIEDVVQRYMPQLHHNMAVAGLSHAVLSIFKGTLEYEVFEVEADFWYTAQLIDAEKEFWRCVQQNVSPVIQTVEPPKLPTEFRDVDMTANNSWASNATDYLANESASKVFEKAKKELKSLVANDAGRAFGHGIEISRSKSGSLIFSKQQGE